MPVESVIDQLTTIEESRGERTLSLRGRTKLRAIRRQKIFLPKDNSSTADLRRHYAAVDDTVLPVMKVRALVLKRFPNGITGKAFFQHTAPEDAPPRVLVETLRIPG